MGRVAPIVLVLLASSCGSSHDPPPVDAGGEDARPIPEMGVCPPEEEAECGCLGEFRRCDVCDLECPVRAEHCSETLGVCRSFGFENPREGCGFSTIEGSPSDGYCSTGQVCVTTSADEPVDGPVGGPCMPPEYCADLQSADPPVEDPVNCFYSDGTRVVTGPPTGGECPVSADPRMPFCGGVCGLRFCPPYEDPNLLGGTDTRYPDCVGLSDDRAFGVCGYERERCVEGARNQYVLESCAEDLGAPCVCLVPEPQPDGMLPRHGYVVLESVCRQYAARFPEHAECVGGDFAPLGG